MLVSWYVGLITMAILESCIDWVSGENCYHVGEGDSSGRAYNELCTRDPDKFFNILSLQQYSLKQLTYATGRRSHRRTGSFKLPGESFFGGVQLTAGCKGLADFCELKEVALIGNCEAFELAILSDLAPPGLVRLTSKIDLPLYSEHNEYKLMDYVPFLRGSLPLPKSLRSMDIVLDCYEPRLRLRDHEALERAGLSLKSSKATLRLWWKRHTSCFPPYLHGELEQQPQLLYDGMTGFFNTIALRDERPRRRGSNCDVDEQAALLQPDDDMPLGALLAQ